MRPVDGTTLLLVKSIFSGSKTRFTKHTLILAYSLHSENDNSRVKLSEEKKGIT